jgi:hypothetical protein
MKKILSVILLATMVASVDAARKKPVPGKKTVSPEKTVSPKKTVPPKSTTNAVVAHLENNWGKYAAGTAGLTLVAAILYDCYKNDAKVMKAALRIAKKSGIVIKDKTVSASQKVWALVENHPVIAISALTGAALIIAEGLDIKKHGYDKSVLGTSLNATKNGLESAGTFVKDETVAAKTVVVNASKVVIDPEKNGWKATKDFSSEKWNKLSEKAKGLFKKEGLKEETPA